MRVDVIGAVLRIILHNENGRLLPESRTADGLNNLAQSKIVIGNVGGGRIGSGQQTLCVIGRETHHHKLWPVTRFLSRLQLLNESMGPLCVPDTKEVAL